MHNQTELRPEENKRMWVCNDGEIVCQKIQRDLRGSSGTEEETVPPRVEGKNGWERMRDFGMKDRLVYMCVRFMRVCPSLLV